MLQKVWTAGINETIGTARGWSISHDVRLYHVDAAASAAFTIHQLPPLFGFHSGAETDFPDALSVADFMRIMHGLTPNFQ